ncbi:MAG: DNA mismatch repair endonuclease MutL, partial [Defluviitaleaceae bacterium]|nr:DNA mismatch repair endonuclease MutL [Defluviitaleaceae bacterium]
NEGTTKIKSLAKNLEETIYNIYGNEFRGNLIEISCLTEENIKITGFAAKPFIFKNNRNFQSFFVNGRYIKSSILTKAVEKAYKTKVPIGKFPCFVLCVTIDPASVDVNAHPTKMEIRFDNDNKIEGLLEKCVDEALREKNLIPKITTKPKLNLNETQETFFKEHSTKKIYDSFGNGSMAFLEPSFNYEASKIYEDTNIYEPKAIEEPIELSIYDNKEDKQEEAVHLENENKGQNYDLETENIEEKVETKQPFFNHYKIIGVFLDTYWIVEQSKSLYIIDQHAAHERILYDEYSEKGFASNAQRLLTPIALTLTDEEELLFKEKAKILEKMGFDVESFGTSYAIRAVPNIIKNITAKDFLEILNGRELTDIARKACKAAVKAHDKLSITEATELIKKLLKTPNPFTCPHGRPTIVEVTKNEIEKMFLRIM